LHIEHIVEREFPFMALFQVFPQRKDLDLELFYFLYMVCGNISTRESRKIIVKETRQSM
jgi:hypothetical protein